MSYLFLSFLVVSISNKDCLKTTAATAGAAAAAGGQFGILSSVVLASF